MHIVSKLYKQNNTKWKYLLYSNKNCSLNYRQYDDIYTYTYPSPFTFYEDRSIYSYRFWIPRKLILITGSLMTWQPFSDKQERLYFIAYNYIFSRPTKSMSIQPKLLGWLCTFFQDIWLWIKIFGLFEKSIPKSVW